MMEPLPLVAALLLLVVNTYQLPMEDLDDILVYPLEPPTNIRKREASAWAKNKKSNLAFDNFIEEKLIQHGQALEHLVKMVQNNEELTKRLIENLSKNVPEPKMPEKVEFMTRRSFGGPPKLVATLQTEKAISPWCSVAMTCQRTVNPICGYDDNFGYGKFDDICHMLQVNCYWKYDFGLVPTCKPTL